MLHTRGRKSRTPWFIVLLLAVLSLPGYAATYSGEFVSTGSSSWIHEGAAPSATNSFDDWLQFMLDLHITFDVTGMTISASSQSYQLQSNNGATATFDLVDFNLTLGGNTGLSSGSLTYVLDGIQGEFLFDDQTYGSTAFNDVHFDGDTVTIFLWGYDTANSLGIDIGIIGSPVPVPPAVWLFASALILLLKKQSH